MNDNDRELVVLAVAGDRSALDRLLYRNYDRVVAHINIRLPADERGAQTAEDVTQDAMMLVARDIRTFEPRANGDCGFLPWMLTIAEHRMFDVLKAHRAKKRGGDLTAHALDVDGDTEVEALLSLAAIQSRTPSGVAARREAVDAAQAAMQGLPSDYRDALTLYYMQNLTYDEVAQRLGRTEGAVRMACKRGLTEIREQLGDVSRFLSHTG